MSYRFLCQLSTSTSKLLPLYLKGVKDYHASYTGVFTQATGFPQEQCTKLMISVQNDMYDYYRHYLNYQITKTAGKRSTADLVG